MPKDFSNVVAAASTAMARSVAARIGERPALDDAARRRREADFTLFAAQAMDFFGSPPADPRHQWMCGRAGYSAIETEFDGVRAIEVRYGVRPTPQRARARDGGWSVDEELGAALVYRQGVDGVMTAYLYPSRSDAFGPEEDGLLIERLTDLESVTGLGKLEAHWSLFRSYAEVTSLDGEPGWRDHARVALARLMKPSMRKGRVRSGRGWAVLETTAAVTTALLAVGALGALF